MKKSAVMMFPTFKLLLQFFGFRVLCRSCRGCFLLFGFCCLLGGHILRSLGTNNDTILWIFKRYLTKIKKCRKNIKECAYEKHYRAADPFARAESRRRFKRQENIEKRRISETVPFGRRYVFYGRVQGQRKKSLHNLGGLHRTRTPRVPLYLPVAAIPLLTISQ